MTMYFLSVFIITKLAVITSNFKNLLGQKFGSLSVKYKDELFSGKQNQLDEEVQFEIDFDDIMSSPPTEAPIDQGNKKKRKDNKR